MELNNNIVEGKQYYYILFLDKVHLFFLLFFYLIIYFLLKKIDFFWRIKRNYKNMRGYKEIYYFIRNNCRMCSNRV